MHLAYIESPFQLIQAVELCQEVERILFVIRLNNVERNNQQVRELVEVFKLSNVVYVRTRFKISIFFYLLPIVGLAYWAKTFFVGDENSILFRLSRYFMSKNKIVLLDDGVATLNSTSQEKYKRYTIFNKVSGRKNSLTTCRKLVESRENQESVNVIVGSKLVEVGICSRETYHSMLDMMTTSIKSTNCKTLYVPHRGENEENLAHISSIYGFEVVHNRLPIELIGYELSINPINIYSVMSTALFSMPLIYSNADIRVFPLSSGKILSRKEAIENLYSIMEENSLFGS